MSASTRPGKNDPGTTDDDWLDRDAYAIAIPDAFKEAYPTADSAAEALRLAEQAPTTTAADAVPTCPHCQSTQVNSKANGDQDVRIDAHYWCTDCGTHLSPPGGLTFDGPAIPTDPHETVVPVEAGSAARYHLADGCSFSGGVAEDATASELAARGLEPCGECAADAVAECDNCGTLTFGAVAGAPQTVCADCTEAADD